MSTEASAPGPARPWAVPLGLFVCLVPFYAANSGPHPVSDALVNMYVPVQALAGGTLTFSPRECPFMFVWELEEPYQTRWELLPPLGPKPLFFGSWDDEILGRKTGELLAEGALKVRQPLYYLTPSSQDARYANIYGSGAGLAALPYFAALALVKPDWRENSRVLWTETRVFAAMCVAGSAVFVYLALLLHLGRAPALGLALLYALGTGVWAEPSQALWQQTPTLLFIAMGLYFLLRLPESPRMAASAGLALGAATLCRPTAGLLFLAVAAWVFLKEKTSRIPFCAGGVLPLTLLALFNWITLGSPFRFGQALAGKNLSADADAYQPASLGEGLLGLLISPSRGLFIFTPLFLFSVWGAVECWRTSTVPALRAAMIAFAATLLVAAKWIAWYGGWCYGYRIVVEWAPLLVLLLIPVAQRILDRKPLRAAFAAAALLSVALQGLGAYGYDMVAWNGRPAVDRGNGDLLVPEDENEIDPAAPKIVLDIDNPAYQGRLWSVKDGQVAWMLRRKDLLTRTSAARAETLERGAKQKWGPPK